MNIGTCLREARERRGVSLRQIAEATKMSPATLLYIERNELDRLPGGIFTKGYLRAYAAEVGVDPEEVVAEFLDQYPAERPVEEPPAPAPIIEFATARRLAAAVAAVVLALMVYGLLPDASESPTASSPDAIEAPDLPTPIEPLVTDGDGEGALPAAARQVGSLQLAIQATGPCWVSAMADGRLVLYQLLRRGEGATIHAREELVLRVGDPEMFAYTLNGVLGRPLGEPGKSVTVRITDFNYRTFLAGAEPDAPPDVPARVT